MSSVPEALVTDSLRRVIAVQDSLLQLAATRPVRMSFSAPPERFWQSNLFSVIVGAGIAVVAQMLGAAMIRRRSKQSARRRLVDQLLVTRDHALQVGQEIERFGLVPFLVGGLVHELDVLDAFIAQDLAQFHDVLTRTTVRTYRANLGRTIDTAHALMQRLESVSQQLQETPDFQRAVGGVAVRLHSDCRRAGRAIILLRAADRCGSSTLLRRARRRVRQLRSRRGPTSQAAG